MHLMHRFSVSCGASRRCTRAQAAVCPQEEITSTSTCAPSTTAVVVNSSRARLRALSTLSGLHLATHVPTRTSFSTSSPLLPLSLLFFFIRPDRPLLNGCVMSPLLRLRSSTAILDSVCSSSLNFLLVASSSLSGLALLINSPPPSRASSPRGGEVSDRIQRVSRCQYAPRGRNVGYLSACSSVALAIRNTGVVNAST